MCGCCEDLEEDLLNPRGLSQCRIAKDIGASARRVNKIVNGQRAITADTALRLGRYFKMSGQFWLNLHKAPAFRTPQLRLGRHEVNLCVSIP